MFCIVTFPHTYLWNMFLFCRSWNTHFVPSIDTNFSPYVYSSLCLSKSPNSHSYKQKNQQLLGGSIDIHAQQAGRVQSGQQRLSFSSPVGIQNSSVHKAPHVCTLSFHFIFSLSCRKASKLFPLLTFISLLSLIKHTFQAEEKYLSQICYVFFWCYTYFSIVTGL